MSETTESADSFTVASTGSTAASDECTLPTFGYPEYNYGWVECNSKTFPGKSYYFNVESLCSTWIRPVSRLVSTPFVRPLNLMSDEDFLDVAPIMVSDIEDDDNDYNNNNNNTIKTEITEECEDVKPPIINRREERQKKIFDEVMFKLYHSYKDEWNIVKNEKFDEPTFDTAAFESENFDEDSNDNFAAILPETCYSSGSEEESLRADWSNNSVLSESFGSLCDFTLWDKKDTETFSSPGTVVSTETESSESIKSRSTVVLHRCKFPAATPKKLSSNKNTTSFDAPPGNECVGIPEGDCDLPNALNCLEVDNFVVSPKSVKQENISDDTISSYETLGQFESTSVKEDDEEDLDDENYINNNFYTLPKLKAIEYSDLLTGDSVKVENLTKRRKRKAPRENEKKTRAKKIIKIVLELNGIRTVNYDYLTPELPDGVKMSNLSDSGSSTCQDAWHELRTKETLAKNPSNELANGAIENSHLTHDLPDIREPYLSESSSSSSGSVENNRSVVKKRLASLNVSERSESDSSGSSTSSSESTASMKSNDKPIERVPGGRE